MDSASGNTGILLEPITGQGETDIAKVSCDAELVVSMDSASSNTVILLTNTRQNIPMLNLTDVSTEISFEIVVEGYAET